MPVKHSCCWALSKHKDQKRRFSPTDGICVIKFSIMTDASHKKYPLNHPQTFPHTQVPYDASSLTTILMSH